MRPTWLAALLLLVGGLSTPHVRAQEPQATPEAGGTLKDTTFGVTTRQFALQGGEVGVRGVVLQLPGHLRLLGLSTAAPHGATPSHRMRGSPKAGPDDVRHLS